MGAFSVEADTLSFFEPKLLKMAKINEAVELLKNLIHSNVYDMIKMSKDALCNIQSCLLHAQEKIDFLQLETQLQQDELHQRVTILNLFLFRGLRRTLIRRKKIKFQLIPIQFLVLEQMYM